MAAAPAAASAHAASAMPEDGHKTSLTFHVVGDAFVDFFCYLEGDWPERGGDSVLDQPVKAYAGGSSVNTATHLTSLIAASCSSPELLKSHSGEEHATSFHPLPNSSVVLQTALNPDDHYGKILLEHTDRLQLNLVNCLRRLPVVRDPSSDGSAAAGGGGGGGGALVNGYRGAPSGAVDAESTGHCVAIVSKGERSFMTHRGCVESFRADHLDINSMISGRAVGDDLHLHVAGYFNMTGFWGGRLQAVLKRVRRERRELNPGPSTTTISLVTQHDASNQWDGGMDELVPLIDFFIMNELEANKILLRSGKGGRGNETSISAAAPEPAVATATKLATADPVVAAWMEHFSALSPTTHFVVTRGADGAVAFQNFRRVATLHPAIAVPVVDPTGAGDSFTAGFLYGIWSRRRRLGPTSRQAEWSPDDIKEGLLWGCAVGTAAVTIRGASVPSRAEDILNLYERQKAKESLIDNS